MCVCYVCTCAWVCLVWVWRPEDNLNYFSPSWGFWGLNSGPPFCLTARDFTCWAILPALRNFYFWYGKCNLMCSIQLAWSLRAERMSQTFPRASLALLGNCLVGSRGYLGTFSVGHCLLTWLKVRGGPGWGERQEARFLLSLCWFPAVLWWFYLGYSFRRGRKELSSTRMLSLSHWG